MHTYKTHLTDNQMNKAKFCSKICLKVENAVDVFHVALKEFEIERN